MSSLCSPFIMNLAGLVRVWISRSLLVCFYQLGEHFAAVLCILKYSNMCHLFSWVLWCVIDSSQIHQVQYPGISKEPPKSHNASGQSCTAMLQGKIFPQHCRDWAMPQRFQCDCSYFSVSDWLLLVRKLGSLFFKSCYHFPACALVSHYMLMNKHFRCCLQNIHIINLF